MNKMLSQFTIFLSLVIPILIVQAIQVGKTRTMPPSIIDEPKSKTYFKGDEQTEKIELPCVAHGEPKPDYRWEKNGNDLNVMASVHIIFLPGIGTITINNPKLDDEGEYQCFASNSYGTSVSIKASVQKAFIETFPNVVEPQRHTPTVGYSLTLMCHIPNSVPAEVSKWWALTDRFSKSDELNMLKDNERITKDYDGNLHFTNILDEDRSSSGMVYVCMVMNPSLRSMVQGADQAIDPRAGTGSFTQVPVDTLWTSPTEVVALKGEKLSMKCIFSGNPTPKVAWTRKGKDASIYKNIHLESYGMELIIDKVEFMDTGVYKCHGVNNVSSTTRTVVFNVDVEASPYWIDAPKDVERGVEESAEFKCNVGGIPKPEVKWYINGVPRDDVPGKRRMDYSLKTKFSNLTKSDQQVIQCNASNIHGYLWADVFLNVLAQQAAIMNKDTVELIKVAKGQSLNMICNATGKPAPTITWYKGNQLLAAKHFVISKDGTLSIKKGELSDKGSYRCRAENRFGFEEKFTDVIVTIKTEIKEKTPDGDKIAGSNIKLVCRVKTDPNEIDNLQVTWQYKNLPLKQSSARHYIDKKKLTLTIFDSVASDTGYYVCNVSNGIDSAQGTIKITVKDKPDKPQEMSLRTCHQHSATVSWRNASDNNSPIKKYIVQYTTSFTPDQWTMGGEAVAGAHNYTVILSPWANYTLRVIAVNAVGQSVPSDVTGVCYSDPALPDKQPVNIRTPTNKKKYLIVKWDMMPQIDHNGPDYRYKVVVKTPSGGTNVYSTMVDDYRTTSTMVPVNTVYEPYAITVESVNRMGTCLKAPQTFIGYSGEDEPNLVPQHFRLDPTRNITATSATFLWSAVDDKSPHMYGVFAGYTIQFWKTGQPDTLVKVKIAKSATTARKRRAVMKDERHSVYSLPPYSNLTVQVSVANTHYIGLPSKKIHLETPEGLPSRVAYLTARIRGANHFVINWGEPKHHNGILTGYDVQYQKVDENEVGALSPVQEIHKSHKRFWILEGLLNDQQYRIYIWAKTRIGRSKPYYIDVITGTSGAPAKPEFMFSNISQRSFNVTWHKVAEGRVTMGYTHQVEYRKLGQDDEWKREEKERTRLWQVVDNLIPGTEYSVRVIAMTAERESSTSSEQTVRTVSAEAHVVQAVATAGWFIGMMATIALLLLILIIVCIIKRNRGDKYHAEHFREENDVEGEIGQYDEGMFDSVQEKERLRGADLDNGEHMDFNPYLDNCDDNSIGKKSGASGDHPGHSAHGSDVDSMEEYAGVDPSKFNEDGSFIGQYGDKVQPGDRNERPPMSTFM